MHKAFREEPLTQSGNDDDSGMDCAAALNGQNGRSSGSSYRGSGVLELRHLFVVKQRPREDSIADRMILTMKPENDGSRCQVGSLARALLYHEQMSQFQ